MLATQFELPRSPVSPAQLHRLDIGTTTDITLTPVYAREGPKQTSDGQAIL